ncbi:MAG TPA: hypothetical protein V6D02_14525 [Candidatus Obscuribacterales bacterium]
MPNRFELTLFLEDSLVQQSELYARLELITLDQNVTEDIAPRSPQSPSRLRRWGQALLAYWVGDRATEPKIWTKRDLDGHDYYVVYDPFDQRRRTFGSAESVRIWLEERYNH